MPNSNLIIASAQFRIGSNIEANGERVRALIENAHSQGAQLILFPEGALSGYVKTQIKDWSGVDWDQLQTELHKISELCATLNMHTVIGSAHAISTHERPHNSLFVISDTGELVARYDKRMLSNTEINDWYTPGVEPVTFEVGGFKFGCAICIEMSFPELFAEYERLGVDCILVAAYGLGKIGGVLLQAHAATNCLWVCASVPAQQSDEGPSGIAGPDGHWISQCAPEEEAISFCTLDRLAARYEIALNKARPWRGKARRGKIYGR